MRYLLVVGFACEVYRKEPRARIFVGDKLIDEFYIPPHKDTLTDNAKRKFLQQLQPFSTKEHTNTRTKNLPTLKFYEIEIEQNYNRLKLRIDIENDDSNSTNGFITKSTLLQLQPLYFFPYNKKFLSFLDKIKIKNRIGKNYAWYRRRKNIFFEIFRNTVWHGKNKQVIIIDESCNIGGSGYFHCELVKKYGVFVSQSIKSNRYELNYSLLNYFCDKYEQYANQGNIN
jgi:hypothetical protein